MRKLILVLFFMTLTLPAQAALDTAKIEKLTGRAGTLDAKENVFKVTYPRNTSDVPWLDGVRITPPLGMTAWAAFKEVAQGHVMVMGDMVLLWDEVAPAMEAALNNGLEVTALHNHFLGESERIMFMHVGGMGAQDDLAKAVRKIFDTFSPTRAIERKKPDTWKLDPADGTTKIDFTAIENTLGRKGALKDGVYKVTIGRKVSMSGHEVGNAMGVNTWMALAGTDQKAVVDGDFAMLESELQGVLKALIGAKIKVVAIHNHMTNETPRLVFLHYWAIGPAQDLVRGIRAALDTQKY